MKYMITAALALCLLGGAAAAQDRDHERGGGPQGAPQGGAPQGGRGEYRGGQQGVPQPGQTHGFRAGPEGGPQGGPRGGPQGGPAPQAVAPPVDRRFEGRQGAPQAQGGPRFEGREGAQYRGGPPAAGPGYRGAGERRGAEAGYRPGFYARDHGWTGGHTFRVSPYRYPAGWGYRHWGFGAFLPFVFLAPDYTLYQYWVYGLPAPPPDYHWIRVGPDALLVRYGDGYILDVVYGIFY